MHFKEGSYDNPVQNGVPSKFCVKRRLQKLVITLPRSVRWKVLQHLIDSFLWFWFANEACVLSLFFSFFLNCIYWKTCQMKVLKWPLCFWWLNMLRVYICHSLSLALSVFYLLDLIGLCILSLGQKHWKCTAAMGLHSCNLDVHSSTLVGTLRCVCVCVHFDGCCLCLRSVLVRGMDIVILKSYLCINPPPLPFVRLTHHI